MKSRYFLLAISVILMCLVLIANEQKYSHDKNILGVGIISCKETENKIKGKNENTEVFHYPVFFEGNNLPYDWQTNTIYIPQNMNIDDFQGKLTSEYGTLWFEDSLTIDNSNKIYTDGFNCEKILDYIKYDETISKQEYIAENATFTLYLIWDTAYSKYNVVFTGMPTISLTYDAYNPEYMSWDGQMSLIDPYHKKQYYTSDKCEFHLRGDSTSHADKKSYELNLDDKKSLIGMRTDDDWALIAMLGDNGYVHNKLAYDLWNRISATNENAYDNTVNSEYVEVFYDNTYAGLYLLCEKIDRKQCKLGEEDYLYRLDELKLDENTNPEFEKQFDFRIKWPKEYSDEDYSIINEFERIFYSKDGFDVDRAKSIVNIENITDMNLYSMLICGVDNWDANCFYIAPKKDDYKISEVMWDMNESFGDDEWFQFRDDYITSKDMMIPYVKKIYDADKRYMSAIMYKRWQKLRKNVIDKYELTKEAENLASYISDSGALTRETDKWNCYMKPEWRYENLYSFIDKRMDFLDSFWKDEYESGREL